MFSYATSVVRQKMNCVMIQQWCVCAKVQAQKTFKHFSQCIRKIGLMQYVSGLRLSKMILDWNHILFHKEKGLAFSPEWTALDVCVFFPFWFAPEAPEACLSMHSSIRIKSEGCNVTSYGKQQYFLKTIKWLWGFVAWIPRNIMSASQNNIFQRC